MEPYFIGQILVFAGNFAPRDTAFCHGQLVAIVDNEALFSLIGTYYGGDGQNTFALPDLRGRIPVGPGNGPGLSSMELSQRGGVESVTLAVAQLPSHSHAATATIGVVSATGNTANPGGATIAGATTTYYAPAANATVSMAAISASVQAAGGQNQPFSNVMPSLGINFVIGLYGIYPQRD